MKMKLFFFVLVLAAAGIGQLREVAGAQDVFPSRAFNLLASEAARAFFPLLLIMHFPASHA